MKVVTLHNSRWLNGEVNRTGSLPGANQKRGGGLGSGVGVLSRGASNPGVSNVQVPVGVSGTASPSHHRQASGNVIVPVAGGDATMTTATHGTSSSSMLPASSGIASIVHVSNPDLSSAPTSTTGQGMRRKNSSSAQLAIPPRMPPTIRFPHTTAAVDVDDPQFILGHDMMSTGGDLQQLPGQAGSDPHHYHTIGAGASIAQYARPALPNWRERILNDY